MTARFRGSLIAVVSIAIVAGIAAFVGYRSGRHVSLGEHIPSSSVATRRIAPRTVPQHRIAGPEVAIIIDDCGQVASVERAMLALPIPITLSILPDAPYTRTIERETAAAHKGIMLHLPMEPMARLDPGPGAITTAMADDRIARTVGDDLRDVPLATGINNHEGSRATADPRVMRDVMAVAAQQHRFFIDSRTTLQTVVVPAARSAGVMNASRNVFLDNEADSTYISDMLRRAAAIAERHDVAIAIGHPRPATLRALRATIGPLEAQGVHFVFAADLLHR